MKSTWGYPADVSTLLKIVRNTVIVLLALYLSLFGLTKAIRYRVPIAAIHLGLAPASKTPDLMPSHIIKAGSKVSDWQMGAPEKIGDVVYNGKTVSFQEFLNTTHTNAFLVIRGGKITYEYYKEPQYSSMRLPSYSVGKTMTSVVVGQLIDQGKIKESDTFVLDLTGFGAKVFVAVCFSLLFLIY